MCFVKSVLPGLAHPEETPAHTQETGEGVDYDWIPAPFGTEVEVEFPKADRHGKMAVHTRPGWFLKNDLTSPGVHTLCS